MSWRRLAVVLPVAVVVGAAAFLSWALLRPGPDRAYELEVAPGTPGVVVLETLHEAGWLPSTQAARLYLEVAARGREIHFGRYRLAPRSRPIEVLRQLLEGRVLTVQVTVVEGLSVDETAAVMAGAGLGSLEEWAALTADADLIRDLSPEALNLEGYLFPDTYRFAEGVDAATVVRHMVDRFRQVWQEERRGVDRIWASTHELVTLASLVEAETSLDDERARIAGVFRNRLHLGMLLQCDPTVVYALKRQGLWEGRLLRVHWELDDPYNTYRSAGLPPGPINSPGRAALAAALSPEAHDELYFVAKPGGGHSFSTNLRDHNRAVARLRQARR